MSRCLPVVALCALALSTGCAHLQSVSMTAMPAESGSTVNAEIESPITVAFVQQDHDYVDDLRAELTRQCSGGRVEGLLTKNEQIQYWGPLIYKTRITAEGTCVRDDSPNT